MIEHTFQVKPSTFCKRFVESDIWYIYICIPDRSKKVFKASHSSFATTVYKLPGSCIFAGFPPQIEAMNAPEPGFRFPWSRGVLTGPTEPLNCFSSCSRHWSVKSWRHEKVTKASSTSPRTRGSQLGLQMEQTSAYRIHRLMCNSCCTSRLGMLNQALLSLGKWVHPF